MVYGARCIVLINNICDHPSYLYIMLINIIQSESVPTQFRFAPCQLPFRPTRGKPFNTPSLRPCKNQSIQPMSTTLTDYRVNRLFQIYDDILVSGLNCKVELCCTG